MRWLLVTLVVIGVGLVGCIKQPAPTSTLPDTGAMIETTHRHRFAAHAQAECLQVALLGFGNCDPEAWHSPIPAHQQVQSVRGILQQNGQLGIAVPNAVVNWTVFMFHEGSRDARSLPLGSVQGTLPLELQVEGIEAKPGAQIEHLFVLKNGFSGLEQTYFDADVELAVQHRADDAPKRTALLRELNDAGEIGACAYVVDPACTGFSAHRSDPLPVEGVVKNLTAELSWDAAWPTTDYLELSIYCADRHRPWGTHCNGTYPVWHGTSPIIIEVNDEFVRVPYISIFFEVRARPTGTVGDPTYISTITSLPQDFTLTASFEDWVYPSNGTRGDRWID